MADNHHPEHPTQGRDPGTPGGVPPGGPGWGDPGVRHGPQGQDAQGNTPGEGPRALEERRTPGQQPPTTVDRGLDPTPVGGPGPRMVADPGERGGAGPAARMVAEGLTRSTQGYTFEPSAHELGTYPTFPEGTCPNFPGTGDSPDENFLTPESRDFTSPSQQIPQGYETTEFSEQPPGYTTDDENFLTSCNGQRQDETRTVRAGTLESEEMRHVPPLHPEMMPSSSTTMARLELMMLEAQPDEFEVEEFPNLPISSCNPQGQSSEAENRYLVPAQPQKTECLMLEPTVPSHFRFSQSLPNWSQLSLDLIHVGLPYPCLNLGNNPVPNFLSTQGASSSRELVVTREEGTQSMEVDQTPPSWKIFLTGTPRGYPRRVRVTRWLWKFIPREVEWR